jgi:hypothetical protein
MRYDVCISNNLREPKNLHGPRNVLECFSFSFLCSETVSLQDVHSQIYSRQKNNLLSCKYLLLRQGKKWKTFNEMNLLNPRPFLWHAHFHCRQQLGLELGTLFDNSKFEQHNFDFISILSYEPDNSQINSSSSSVGMLSPSLELRALAG